MDAVIVRHYYSVHELAWGADSHLGDYPTLAKAVTVAHTNGSKDKGASRVQIYSSWDITLPLGWRLTRDTRLTDWKE